LFLSLFSYSSWLADMMMKCAVGSRARSKRSNFDMGSEEKIRMLLPTAPEKRE
jgi:hypothetical protein